MKRVLDYFRPNRQSANSASLAKERLQIIIAHERGNNTRGDFLANLRQELVAVIAKHLNMDITEVRDKVKFDMAHSDEHSVMELNITIPDQELATRD